jgi:hypothetical protein
VFLVSNTTFLILTLPSNSVRSSLHFVSKSTVRSSLRYTFTLCFNCLKYYSNQRVAALVEPFPSKARDEGSNLVPASLFCWFKIFIVTSHVIRIVTSLFNTNTPLAERLVLETVIEPTRVRTSLVTNFELFFQYSS